MPGGDRTGPMGMGPRTGRAAGLCAGYGTPGYMNPTYRYGFGGGFGRGRGFGGGGRGWRHRFYATGQPGWMGWNAPAPMPAYESEMNAEALKQEADLLEKQLENVRKRLDQLQEDNS